MADLDEDTPLVKHNNNDEPDNHDSKCNKFYKLITSNQWLFYYCGIISSWDDRSWFFLIGIYLVALDPSNLILAAIFGFLSSGFVICLGSVFGSWIDRTSRLKAFFTVIAVRNISTLLCSVVLCLVFFYYQEVVVENKLPIFQLLAKICLVLFGVLAHVTGLANNTIVGKDWLAILCIRDNYLLSKMTSRFRLLDMVSKIIAPVIIGQIMTFAGKSIAAIFFSIQVLLSLLLYTYIGSVIYKRMPRLHYREDNEKEEKPAEYTYEEIGNVEEPTTSFHKTTTSFLFRFFEGWLVYFRQRIVLAGLAMALLYMTVLGFDTVTVGYALSQGMKESTLSLFNAGAAITGIIGALMFPYLMRCLGNSVPTGSVALVLQIFGLVPCIVSVWAPGSPFMVPPGNNNQTDIVNSTSSSIIPYPQNEWSWSLMLLMSGIVLSRMGLWIFDLTVSQLLIETVSEIHRGKVNGVQNSLNMLFELIKFGLVLALPQPNQFGILVILSVSAIICSFIFYFIFALQNHCHLDSIL